MFVRREIEDSEWFDCGENSEKDISHITYVYILYCIILLIERNNFIDLYVVCHVILYHYHATLRSDDAVLYTMCEMSSIMMTVPLYSNRCHVVFRRSIPNRNLFLFPRFFQLNLCIMSSSTSSNTDKVPDGARIGAEMFNPAATDKSQEVFDGSGKAHGHTDHPGQGTNEVPLNKSSVEGDKDPEKLIQGGY